MANYREHKERREKKVKEIVSVVLAVVICIVAALCVFSLFVPAATWKYHFGLPKVGKRKTGELRAHFLSVGQGDCTILELPDGRSVIIDGGNGKKETELTVMRYLNALGIEKPDFVILTHSDSDHAGSLDKVLRYKGAGTVYMPKLDDVTVNEEYAEFWEEAEKTDAVKRYSQVGETILSKDGRFPYQLVFLSPHALDNPKCEYNKVNDGVYGDNDMNDTSAVVWLNYGGTSILFTGDASATVETSLMLADSVGLLKFPDVPEFDLASTEILKVSHHGSSDASSAAFLEYLHLKTAVISVGENNMYEHPSADVLTRLSSVGANVYRTDEVGHVTVTISSDSSYMVSGKRD